MEKKNSKSKKIVEKISEEAPTEIKKLTDNKQMFWILGIMIAMILIVIAVPMIIKAKNNFEYIGLDFSKVKEGELIFYDAKIPVGDLETQKVTGFYTMSFRNDPRELDFVNINITNDLITFNQNKPLYISIDPEAKSCEDNVIAISNLVQFLMNFGGLEIESAYSEEEYAKQMNKTYANCQTTQSNTVMVVKSGEKSQVSKIGDNCYELVYSDCEFLPVSEKFMIVILDKYMDLFTKQN